MLTAYELRSGINITGTMTLHGKVDTIEAVTGVLHGVRDSACIDSVSFSVVVG